MMDVVKPQRKPRRAWIKQVIAPLLGFSLGLHGLLLLAPLPAPKPVEETPETDPAAEETAVDLLSISALATATPIPESSPANPSPAAAPPPAAPTAPAPYPAGAPPVPLANTEVADPVTEPLSESTDTPPPTEPAQGGAESTPTPGFDPNRQSQLVGSAAGVLGRAPGSSNFDLTDQFPGDIWDLYISGWGAAKQQCFFSAIARDSYTLRPPAADLRYLSRNIQLVEQQDIPRTFSGQVVQPLDTAYCEADLFEVQDNGVPILWVSLVPVSPGGSTTLVVFWQAGTRL